MADLTDIILKRIQDQAKILKARKSSTPEERQKAQKEAKEGGIRAFMLNIKDSGALEEDRRDDFDEFLAKKIKGFEGFK